MRQTQPDVRLIEVAIVHVPERLRPVDEAWVEAISVSLAAIGLQEPITCNYPPSFPPASGGDERGGATRVPDFPDRVELVAGAHRLAAARRLGWSTIPARLIAVDPRQARLIEIDENVMRRELSALDRGIFLAERKAVWEDLHPETKRGGDRKSDWSKRGKSNGQHDRLIGSAMDVLSFAGETAKRTGLSESTIRRAVALVTGLDAEALALLRLHPIADNAAQLAALARLEPALQRKVARRLADSDAKDLRAALGGPSKPHDGFAALTKAWARAGAKERRRFLLEIGLAAEAADAAVARARRAGQ